MYARKRGEVRVFKLVVSRASGRLAQLVIRGSLGTHKVLTVHHKLALWFVKSITQKGWSRMTSMCNLNILTRDLESAIWTLKKSVIHASGGERTLLIEMIALTKLQIQKSDTRRSRADRRWTQSSMSSACKRSIANRSLQYSHEEDLTCETVRSEKVSDEVFPKKQMDSNVLECLARFIVRMDGAITNRNYSLLGRGFWALSRHWRALSQ